MKQKRMTHLVAGQPADPGFLVQTFARKIIYLKLKGIILLAGQISMNEFLEHTQLV